MKFPPSFSTEAMSLIRGLLKKDPAERLGSTDDVEEIKKHAFFVRHVSTNITKIMEFSFTYRYFIFILKFNIFKDAYLVYFETACC